MRARRPLDRRVRPWRCCAERAPQPGRLGERECGVDASPAAGSGARPTIRPGAALRRRGRYLPQHLDLTPLRRRHADQQALAREDGDVGSAQHVDLLNVAHDAPEADVAAEKLRGPPGGMRGRGAEGVVSVAPRGQVSRNGRGAGARPERGSGFILAAPGRRLRTATCHAESHAGSHQGFRRPRIHPRGCGRTAHGRQCKTILDSSRSERTPIPAACRTSG